MGGAGLVTVTVLVWPPHSTRTATTPPHTMGTNHRSRRDRGVPRQRVTRAGRDGAQARPARPGARRRGLTARSGVPGSARARGRSDKERRPDLRAASLRHWQAAVHRSPPWGVHEPRHGQVGVLQLQGSADAVPHTDGRFKAQPSGTTVFEFFPGDVGRGDETTSGSPPSPARSSWSWTTSPPSLPLAPRAR